MKLFDLARKIGATILTNSASQEMCIDHVYAGDRISDLLNHAGEKTLLVSNLASSQLVRLAELMDVSGLCMVNGHMPDAAVIQAANSHGTVIMVSPVCVYETCGRLYEVLAKKGSGDP